MPNQIFSVFLDESGNTGANYLDPNQPFFICGGWVVPDSLISTARKVIRKWEKDISRNKHELKGSNLAKRRDGRLAIIELCERLGRMSAMPVYCLMEKRFGICAKYTDAFFDPEYNKALPRHILEDIEFKYSFADDIFHVLQGNIEAFGKAIRSQDRCSVEDELIKIEKVLVNHKIKGVEYILKCPRNKAIDYLVFGDGISNSINNTVFLTLISKIEMISRYSSTPTYNVYHDRTDAFGKSFRAIKNKLRKGWANYLVSEFQVPIPKGKYRLRSLRFRDSKKDTLIRAADYFLSLMKYYIERLDDKELFENKNERRGLAVALGPVLRYVSLIPDSQSSHEIIPTSTGIRILKAMGVLKNNK